MSRLIWTNHAQNRLKERKTTAAFVEQAFSTPDHTSPGKQNGTREFIKKVDRQTITLVAKPSQGEEWVVLSFWLEPPNPDSIDIEQKKRYREYQKASGWKKFWLIVKEQLGL
jgi:hypothetical protein